VEDQKRKGFVADRTIVEGIRAGQESAQGLLWDKYWPCLIVTARNTGLSQQDAEEVVSDVFFRMLQRIKGRRTGDNVGPLLRSAARNAAFSHYRQNRKTREHETEPFDPDVHTFEADTAPESAEVVSYKVVIVRQALEKLSPSDQEILGWVAHGATNEELADWADTNLNNARQLRMRGLRRLQREILTIIQGLPEEERR
jgi:RNA polymerase sigma factor (sigma-70 family)